VDVKAIAGVVGKPENAAIGQRISDDAITLVRDNGKLLPLKHVDSERNDLPFLYQRVKTVRHPVLVVILCDNVRAEDGRVLEREFRTRMPDANILYVDPRVAYARSEEVLKAVNYARAVVVAVYIVPSAARTLTVTRGLKNPASLPPSTAVLFGTILAHAKEKTAVLAMGNPYLTDDFPAIQNYICAFSNATVSEVSAARALFGEIPIHGHLPVRFRIATIQSAGIERPGHFTDARSSYLDFQGRQWLLNSPQLP
jgi:beta-N-acetylhexosaminidase